MMILFRRSVFTVAASLLATVCSAAEKPRIAKPLDVKTLKAWKAKGPVERSRWTLGVAKVDPANTNRLVADPPGNGPVELITCEGHGSDIYTVEKFGDCTIEIEVMVPRGSNSGIYVMGEYEIQVLDSFGRQSLGPGDMGGLYGAKPPMQNASKKPGDWQKYVIEFIAPKFDGDKKIANARFVKITLNGKVIHENVEMPDKTPGGVSGREVAMGPLMLQGNHGAVAYRNIKITAPSKQ